MDAMTYKISPSRKVADRLPQAGCNCRSSARSERWLALLTYLSSRISAFARNLTMPGFRDN